MKNRQVKFVHGFISILLLAIIIFISTVIYKAEPHMPLIIGCVIAGLMAFFCGCKWDKIFESMLGGISKSLEAILILICIGILISSWIASGTVPALIYYGLKLINPKFFLVTTFIICSIISMVMGAWGAAGSIGLAFMGIGQVIGAPASIVAGAIVSGVYVGDKLSPFSDGTNLAASVANINTFTMIKQMIRSVGLVYIITIIIYTFIGLAIPVENTNFLEENISLFCNKISTLYEINILTILPLVIMLICMFFKVPSIPAILCGSLVGILQAIIMQNVNIQDVFEFIYTGYISNTGNEVLDKLLTAGGIEAMMRTVSIILIAMAFGGIMQGTGQMEALVAPIVKKIRSVIGMIILTIVTCISVNIVLPDQYLGIMVPGQMYALEYDKRNIDRLTLGNVLGAGAAVTSALIPWNTCGMYMTTILKVNTLNYLPYCFFNYLLPIIFIFYFALFKNRKDDLR